MKIAFEKYKYGYVTVDGKIVSKFSLPEGEYTFADNSTITYVASEAELAAVKVYVYVDPEKLKEAADEAAIKAAIEKLAISQAKADSYTFESNKFKDK